MDVLDDPLLVLYEDSLNEDGSDVLLLASQLPLKPALGLLKALGVLVEPLVSASVLEDDKLEDGCQTDKNLGFVRTVPQHLLQNPVHKVNKEGSCVGLAPEFDGSRLGADGVVPWHMLNLCKMYVSNKDDKYTLKRKEEAVKKPRIGS